MGEWITLPEIVEHVYSKEDLINRFDGILNRTLGEIDDLGIFNQVQEFDLQKGVAGTIIEQCVLRYPPDRNQRPDLIVIDGGTRIPTELKTTGLRISNTGGRHFIAKEPMSITAVGVYDIANQTFYNSHLWSKIEHMLIVYYHYLADNAVPPAEYASFPVKGYEFHQFSDDEIETLKNDWFIVHDLCANIVSHYPGPHTLEWKAAVKQEYINRHGALRRFLSYLELVPKFPPRFRLKKPVVNTIVANHFGYDLEQLPGRYVTITDVDAKCDELRNIYGGLTIGEIADRFGVSRYTADGDENKGITEQVVVKMFGGESHKLNRIELFQRFGLIAKSIAVTSTGGRTEDMKLYHIDFDEMTKTEYTEEDGTVRDFEFEDSELFEYFSGNEFLCIIFREPPKEYETIPGTHRRREVKHPLGMNTFLGFKRLIFSEKFINTTVRACWDDTRAKIFNHTLEDVINRYKDGSPRYNANGEISSAPNFMKAAQNTVFIRGGGKDSSSKNKTECVNGIRMLPQFIWLKGSAVVEELGLTAESI